MGDKTQTHMADVPLDDVAIWDVPHHFDRGEPRSSHLERVARVIGDPLADDVAERVREATSLETWWQRVFSYGLLVPELKALYSVDGMHELAARWGSPEVAELRDEMTAGQTARPARLVITSDMLGLREFVAAVHDAAGRVERVPAGFEEFLRKFLDDVARPDRFVWGWDRQRRRRVRMPFYETLLERLSIELDHLVSRKPRLSHCKLCGRVFVPLNVSRPERYCRANLWLAYEPGAPRGRRPEHLERCIPLDETERLRTRKRLGQRYRRLLARHGGQHKTTRAAWQVLRAFEERNPPSRTGRQPRPAANYVVDLDEE